MIRSQSETQIWAVAHAQKWVVFMHLWQLTKVYDKKIADGIGYKSHNASFFAWIWQFYNTFKVIY